MRSLPAKLPVLIIGAILACIVLADSLWSPGVAAIQVEPVIWQLNRDYPGSVGGDAGLPITTVYIKTHDGTDWMSTFDSHPNAVSGGAKVRELIDIYAAEGIEVSAWFVPKGLDFDRQVQMAVEVIDAGVTALYADLEPFQGFCYLNCATLADNFWTRVRQERPNAHLGVIYDPRPWWWEQSATSRWFSVANSALPMCYWETYAGQNPWDDPAGCVTQAHADLSVLSPGRILEYVPMLQGDSTAPRFQQALDAAVRVGSERVSVWRRGVMPQEVWDLIQTYTEPEGPRCTETLVDGCLIREASRSEVYFVHGGARFWVPSAEALYGMGFTWRDVQVVPIGAAGGLGLVPVEGTLLREHGDARVFVVYAGARFWIPDPDQFARLGFSWERVGVIPPGGLNQIPLIPAGEYLRLTELSSPQEWLMLRGGRLPLDEAALDALIVAGLAGGTRYLLPDGALQQVPLVELPRGDADCDGFVIARDVTRVLQHSSGLPHPGFCINTFGDVNCSGVSDAADALTLLLWLAGEPATAPEGCGEVGVPVPARLPDPPSPTPEPSPPPTPGPSPSSEPTATATAGAGP